MAEAAGVRLASAAEAAQVGAMLDDFNREFGEATPGPESLARRIELLLDCGDTDVLVAGEGPDGVAVLRFREAIWHPGPECYLAELYVRPGLRGKGLGRALLSASIARARARGAGYIELGTGEHDVVAHSLYESFGFSNREGRPDGPLNYYYELDLTGE